MSEHLNHTTMEFISVEKELKGTMLSEGRHTATITEVLPATPSGKDKAPWEDTTPQLIVKFENDNGFISNWYNLKGYQRKADFDGGVCPPGHSFVSSPNNNEEYLMNNKTFMRVEDEKRTADAQRIFCELAQAAGIEAGEKFSEKDLINQEVGVVVRTQPNNASKVEVHYTTNVASIEAAITA